MLTGTLVTAGRLPLPIGFANSARSANMPAAFLDRGDRAGRLLVRRGDLHTLYRRQAAAEYHGHHNHDPHAVYETRVYRSCAA